jgi:pimeloyl-ACP methyl ester carboxylesterase
VEQLADELVAAVERTLSQTGANKVHLVGHSLGGVVIAQAIAGGGLVGMVDTVITLGSPFGGSPWAGLLPFGDLLRALRPSSPLLRRLASAPVPDGVRWLAVTAALDIIVPGPRSVPTHADVETITVDGIGHLGMLICRRVVDSRRLSRTRAARGGGAAYASVANGRRTSRNGDLTEGVHPSGCPAKLVAAAITSKPSRAPGCRWDWSLGKKASNCRRPWGRMTFSGTVLVLVAHARPG